METVFDFDIVFLRAAGVDCTYTRCLVEMHRDGLCLLRPRDGSGIRVTHISNILGIVLPQSETDPAIAKRLEEIDNEIPF
jgi:hypothetical protein